MTDVKRHREFWISEDLEEIRFSDGTTCGLAFIKKPQDEEIIHTIEISAVKELEEALNISKLEYEFLSANDRHQHKLILDMRAEIEKLKNLLNVAVDALDFNYEYYAAKQHKCIDLLKEQMEKFAIESIGEPRKTDLLLEILGERPKENESK